jgi:hypothetical protein
MPPPSSRASSTLSSTQVKPTAHCHLYIWGSHTKIKYKRLRWGGCTAPVGVELSGWDLYHCHCFVHSRAPVGTERREQRAARGGTEEEETTQPETAASSGAGSEPEKETEKENGSGRDDEHDTAPEFDLGLLFHAKEFPAEYRRTSWEKVQPIGSEGMGGASPDQNTHAQPNARQICLPSEYTVTYCTFECVRCGVSDGAGAADPRIGTRCSVDDSDYRLRNYLWLLSVSDLPPAVPAACGTAVQNGPWS